ncbi:MAG TPA: hemolysin family protein [Anaerolineae bacterium]|nr:hemolysin family protein [Anaerolineae bacterium]
MKLLWSLLSFPRLVFLAATVIAESVTLGASAVEEPPGLETMLVPSLVIIILVLFNGLFVAAEFAIIGVRPTQIEQMANKGQRVAKAVLKVLDSPHEQNKYIATAQLGITIASLGLGMYGEVEISHFIEPYLARLLNTAPDEAIIYTLGYIISVSILTYLHVVVGEMIPKSLALTTPVKTVLWVFRPMRLTETIFAVPVAILNGIGNGLLRFFRIPPAEGHARLHSPEELDLIVAESAEGGLLNEEEEEMIHNIFSFGKRQVNQIMTPRRKVKAISHDTPLPELLAQVAESQHSRFPVYEDDLDHIVGTLHLKDVVYQQLRMKGSFDIRLLLRPALIVPENYLVAKLLAAFKRQRVHMAIVLDEFGGTAGIVTLEDLVEEVVGEVRDEFDLESEPLVELAPGVLEVAGNYLLEDLEDYVYLGQAEDLPDVETIGGLIMTELGRPPRQGDQVTHNGDVHFTVLAVDGLAVARARIEFSAPDGKS